MTESIELKKLVRDDSLESFEFVDLDGDLDVDLSKCPITEATNKLSSGIGLIMSALCTIVEEQGLLVSIPVRTMATTAVGAVTGSLIGGTPGLAVGLITAAIVAYRASPKRRSKSPKPDQGRISIRQILSQLSLQQKKELLRELLGCLKQSNVRCLILEILKNETIRNMALEILSSFLMKKMGVSLVKPK